jgi:hypothetical protein
MYIYIHINKYIYVYIYIYIYLGSNPPPQVHSISDTLKMPLSASQRHLPLHTDESTHSLIIALNSLGGYGDNNNDDGDNNDDVYLNRIRSQQAKKIIFHLMNLLVFSS